MKTFIYDVETRSFAINMKSNDGKHTFTEDELKNIRDLINKNKSTIDSLMQWVGIKATADDLVKTGFYDGRDNIRSLNDALEVYEYDRIKDNCTDEIAKLVNKLGFKFKDIADTSLPRIGSNSKSIYFGITFKDVKDLHNAVDFIKSNFRKDRDGYTEDSLYYTDTKSGVIFTSIEGNDGLDQPMIWSHIDKAKIKSYKLPKI